MLIEYGEKTPRVDKAVYVADNAVLAGDVRLGEGCSVWFGAVLRADESTITIGARSNVQDNATIHVDYSYPVAIGEDVTIGHNAIVHGATVEDGVLIGMHATVMNGAHIGAGSLIAAGALVTENMVIPERSLVVGMPGKVIRVLDDDAVSGNLDAAAGYVALAGEFAGIKARDGSIH